MVGGYGCHLGFNQLHTRMAFKWFSVCTFLWLGTIQNPEKKKSSLQMFPVFRWLLYSGGLNTEHWNTKCFEVWISNFWNCQSWLWSQPFENWTIQNQNKISAILSNDFGQNSHHFVLISHSFGPSFCLKWNTLGNRKTLENRTEGYHWNIERIWFSSSHCI